MSFPVCSQALSTPQQVTFCASSVEFDDWTLLQMYINEQMASLPQIQYTSMLLRELRDIRRRSTVCAGRSYIKD